MNESLKLKIGQKMSIKIRVKAMDGSYEDEYIQGVLKEVNNDLITIRQYFPYQQFLVGDKETPFEDRIINTASYIPLSVLKH